jgi:16S rRNA (guanine527-N7)-methyltransferase
VNETIERFAIELLRWNARINLTAARSLEDLRPHLVDCEALLPYIPGTTQRVIDVGSGGGFPAAVVAIHRPELTVTALEPVHKKHAFLQHVRRTICPNLVPLAERIEQHEGRDYDVATSRATFALDEWLTRGRALVRNGGVVLGMEGVEQIALPDGAERHAYALDDRTRAIIVLRV